MARAPELTVVIPTRDRPGILPKAVWSVLGQVEGAEVIVVDDGSAAEAAETIRSFAATDPRIRLVRNETSEGAPSGRNRGLAMARGRYWATLDDDDRWLPGKWETQRAIFEAHGHPEDLVVVTAIRMAHPDRNPLHMPLVREPGRFPSLDSLFEQVPPSAFLNSFVLPTALMRRLGGYDGRLVWGEHTDLQIRLSTVARFAGTGLVGVEVDRAHGLRSKQKWALRIDGIRLLLDKHHAAFSRAPDIRGRYLHVLGVNQVRLGDRWGGVRTLLGVALRGPSPDRRLRALGLSLATATGAGGLWQRMSDARRPRVLQAAGKDG